MGLSIFFKQQKAKWWIQFAVSFAGPATNFIIAVILAGFAQVTRRETIIYTNLLLGIFNLLPVFPLDGGRMLKAVLQRFYTIKITDEYIHKISNMIMVILTVIASIGTIYLKNIAVPLIIIYLWIITIAENKRYKLKRRMCLVLEKEAANINF